MHARWLILGIHTVDIDYAKQCYHIFDANDININAFSCCFLDSINVVNFDWYKYKVVTFSIFCEGSKNPEAFPLSTP